MNTYLIPTTPTYQYEPYDHIYMLYAKSPQEAYNIAKEKLNSCIPQELTEYEYYETKLFNIPDYPFHKSKKYDIIYQSLLKTKGFEYMAYFNVDWNNYTEELSKMAQFEEWSNSTYPNKKILTNYMYAPYNL